MLNAHNVIPIIRSRLYCVVSAAKPLMQPKTLVRKYQTILRFILDLLKLGKSLEKKSRVYPSYFICHTKSIIYTKVHRIYSSVLNIEYFLYWAAVKYFQMLGCTIVTQWHFDTSLLLNASCDNWVYNDEYVKHDTTKEFVSNEARQ